MKAGKHFSVLLFLCLFLTTGNAQKNTSQDPFFFIQVTDPQFGMFRSDSGFSKETDLYQKAVDQINRLVPDFVVITGDLVNNKGDISQIAEFKRITSEINKGIPVYFLPGNHDIGQSPTQQDINTFVSDYGYDRFSFKHKKSLFIGLNSSLIKANTPVLEQQQFTWLKRKLSKGKRAGHIVLFSHYPFFINSFDEPETYSNIPVEIRNKYLALFKENNVNVVFAGHLHNNASSQFGNMTMVTTSAVGKPLAKAPSGFRIIKIFPDHIESKYYSVDEIPASISFY